MEVLSLMTVAEGRDGIQSAGARVPGGSLDHGGASDDVWVSGERAAEEESGHVFVCRSFRFTRKGERSVRSYMVAVPIDRTSMAIRS